MEKCSENNECVTDAILAFDTLYTTNHMKILKLLLPYLELEHQKKMAVFIKWQELMFTMNFFKKYSASLYQNDFVKKKPLDLNVLLPLLTPYCNTSEKATLSGLAQMQNMMHMMEEMQQYMPMIQQFMSSMSGEENSFGNMGEFGNDNMMNMLKNMMSEEQQAMFSMFMEGGQL